MVSVKDSLKCDYANGNGRRECQSGPRCPQFGSLVVRGEVGAVAAITLPVKQDGS